MMANGMEKSWKLDAWDYGRKIAAIVENADEKLFLISPFSDGKLDFCSNSRTDIGRLYNIGIDVLCYAIE